jgi:GT2 family glycosyltransferase
MLEVSCVIVSFDSERFLLRCVESLLHTTPNAISIIIVDNGPKESFSNYLCESLNSMGFTVVPYVGNRGFGAACNAGIAASVTNTPILLVNPDAVVSVDDIAYLSDVLARQPAFGIVGPVLTLSDRSHVVNGGSFPSLAHLIRSKFGRRRQARLDPHPGSVAVNDRECLRMDWVSGAVMMIRREAWDAVGGFDPAFFLYYEDIDLCRRVRAAGWEVGIVPGATAIHESGGSQWRPGSRTRVERIYFESQAYYFRKHYGRLMEWLLRVFRFPYLIIGLRRRFVSRYGVTVGSH